MINGTIYFYVVTATDNVVSGKHHHRLHPATRHRQHRRRSQRDLDQGTSDGGTYSTDFRVETSATLSRPWTQETEGVNVTITVDEVNGDEVKYTLPAGTKNFARLKVTGP